MKFLNTDGTNPDFIALCGLLDRHLNAMVGGEKQREQYIQYNTLEQIHDVIVVYDGERPIACASFKDFWDGIAEVKRVFLREEYRGTGIAERLLIALEEKARRRGYGSLVLETGNVLKAACRFYEKMGFQRIENYGPYREMTDSICMKKDI